MTGRRRRRWLTLDGSVRRLDGGRVLLGGSPMRLFRLTEAGARLVDRIEAGQTVAEGALVDRLLDAGAAHPGTARPGPLTRRIFEESPSEATRGVRPGTGAGGPPGVPDPAPIARRIFEESASEAAGSAQVTVVLPVFRTGSDPAGDDELARRIGRLGPGGPGAPGDVAAVVVVDDASPRPVAVPAGVTLLRHHRNQGPGAARQTGLAAVTTAFVAFVDADVDLPDGWLAPLLAHFADPAVVAVAPRVTGRTGPGRLARYDAARSPLDLGPAPAPVRPRTRVSYVPTAVLVARTDAVRRAGGFDPTLRTGEDVDLVWRLAARPGARLRYEPSVVVTHDVRPTLGAWLRQRHGYGRSAAPLARRHPGALAPVAVSGWSAASWLLVAAGWPVAGLATAVGSTLALPRKLQGLAHPVAESVRIAGRGHLYAGRQLASALTRAWWPVALAAALVSRRARRTLLAAVVVPALLDRRATRPDVDPVTWTALRALDDAAYGSGLWRGVLAERTAAPLVPDLSNWPGKGSQREGASDSTGAADAPPPAGDATG